MPQAPVPQGPPAEQRVKVPAILMMIFAGLSAAYYALQVVLNLVGSAPIGGGEAMKNVPTGVAGALLSLVFVAKDGFVVFGALKLMKLESRGLAMAAAVISVIPLCSACCILGIPWGIWALVVMSNPEVKAAFRG